MRVAGQSDCKVMHPAMQFSSYPKAQFAVNVHAISAALIE